MPKQSWFIAFEIPEPVKTEIENIKIQISNQYGTLSVLKSPAHITIVPPFFWDNGVELNRIVQTFSFNPIKLQLDGYGSFDSKVVFIKIGNHQPLESFYEAFNQFFFEKYPSLKRTPTFPFHPHITVGNRDWKTEDFKRCLSDFSGREFTKEITLASLTLFKLINGKWESFKGEL